VTICCCGVVQQVEEPDDFFRPQPLPHVEVTSPRHAAQVLACWMLCGSTFVLCTQPCQCTDCPLSLSSKVDGTASVRLQVARDRQAATLQQALAAMAGSGRGASHARPLPHIYGSAEYLQDVQAWLQC
jgi:hypothetical protein